MSVQGEDPCKFLPSMSPLCSDMVAQLLSPPSEREGKKPKKSSVWSTNLLRQPWGMEKDCDVGQQDHILPRYQNKDVGLNIEGLLQSTPFVTTWL